MDTNIFLELQAINELLQQQHEAWQPVLDAFPVLMFLLCIVVGILLHLVFQQVFKPHE